MMLGGTCEGRGCKVMSNASRLARCCNGLTVEGHLTHSLSFTRPTLYEVAEPPKPIHLRV